MTTSSSARPRPASFLRPCGAWAGTASPTSMPAPRSLPALGIPSLHGLRPSWIERRASELIVKGTDLDSTENWSRPSDEVGALFEAILRLLRRQMPTLQGHGGWLRWSDRPDRAPGQVRQRSKTPNGATATMTG